MNLTINKGDFALIIGKTGSGKSTLLRQLKPELALGKATAGELTLFNGHNDDDFSRVAYISQFVDNQMVTETARDEFHFVLENLGMQPDQVHSKIAEIASYFDIVNLLDLKEAELSGGQKQIVNLAAALILDPDILLLDEPTSQLDPITSEKFLRLVKKINDDLGISVVLVEHSLEQAIFYVNRMFVIEDGQIILDQPTDRALRDLYKHDGYREYLPQLDRLFLENQLDEIYPTIQLPLNNRRMDGLLQNQVEYLKYRDHVTKQHNPTSEALRIKNLTFRFDFNARNILDDLNFTLEKGRSYAILGPNGVGKTTLLRVLTHQLSQLNGQIYLNCHKIKKFGKEFLEQIFILPQNPALLFLTDTVKGEIEYQLKQKDPETTESETTEYLTKYHLTNLKDTNPYDLSGGQQEYLGLVIGLIKDPTILFLDEPTKGLDPNMKKSVAQMLQQYQASGGTILASTHDVLFSTKHFDYVCLMFDGKLGDFETPINFFPEKYFYTTEINKAVRDYFPKALIWEDIINNES
ncbi:ABC transporter [Companilactobacillus versmoldensis DSM 14857 = KCTC 3814]|uniref:ABC transporter n=2 Tax=Companilactobacillus versmoldensis TaxID=194326 RepID=A0A0R1SPP4_9LACO|nr:ABC transporter [Companilactobacillus versmoldensis DSM 14857 = KCTC 3814]